MKKTILTVNDIRDRVHKLSSQFVPSDRIFGVPRGGVPVALCMCEHYGCDLASTIEDATIIVDDVIDSGATLEYYGNAFPSIPFVGLFDKRYEDLGWITFPWETAFSSSLGQNVDCSTHDIFTRLLQYIGEDPKREGLIKTPARMAKAWLEWTQGYGMKAEDFTAEFKDGAEKYDELILEKNLPFYSHCEHHLVPFFGVAHIAYIPARDSVIGISKLGRILDMYAQRLQIQERLTTQIADCIQDLVEPSGIAVVIEARHLCTESRGLKKQGQETVTSAMRGVFRESAAARNEFMLFIKG